MAKKAKKRSAVAKAVRTVKKAATSTARSTRKVAKKMMPARMLFFMIINGSLLQQGLYRRLQLLFCWVNGHYIAFFVDKKGGWQY